MFIILYFRDMKEVLNKIIKFITSKRVKKFFAREFLILFFGALIWGVSSIYVNTLEQSLNNDRWQDFVAYEFPAWLLILLYGTRVLYLLFRFIKLCFRIVFFDK